MPNTVPFEVFVRVTVLLASALPVTNASPTMLETIESAPPTLDTVTVGAFVSTISVSNDAKLRLEIALPAVSLMLPATKLKATVPEARFAVGVTTTL